MTFKQVADLFQVSLFTIYHWSSLGRFDRCKFKVGKIVRVHRDKMLKEFFSESFLK
jgi:predicted site-specific integrase-resolvase